MKQWQSLRGLTPILKEVQLMGKMLSNSAAFYREIACEKKGNLMQQT